MNFRTAAIAFVILIAVMLAGLLYATHNIQKESATYVSTINPDVHAGDNWHSGNEKASHDHSQAEPEKSTHSINPAPLVVPITTFKDFYSTDKSGAQADTSDVSPFNDFYSGSGAADKSSETSFNDFYSGRESDSSHGSSQGIGYESGHGDDYDSGHDGGQGSDYDSDYSSDSDSGYKSDYDSSYDSDSGSDYDSGDSGDSGGDSGDD